jgi:hypothetical protein
MSTHAAIELEQVPDDSAAGCDLVRQWLREHNLATNPTFMDLIQQPEHDARTLVLLAKEAAQIVGGLIAETQLSWLRISIMAAHLHHGSASRTSFARRRCKAARGG